MREKPSNIKQDDYIEIATGTLPTGPNITFYGRKEGPSLDDMVRKVYQVTSHSTDCQLGPQ